MCTIEVRYVNGHLIEAAPSGWPILRGDGLDYVDLRCDGQAYRMQGRSCYWLYREDGLWVVGGGTVTDVDEVVAAPGGVFERRAPEFMPDLAADRVKWGHWEGGPP